MDTRFFVGILIICVLGVGASLFRFNLKLSPDTNFSYPEIEQDSLFNLVNYYDEAILPLPLKPPVRTDEVILGELLFDETRISSNGKSCTTCHDLSQAGINPSDQWTEKGSAKFNTPGMYNTRFLSKRFWLGKTISPESQVKINFVNGMEITSTEVVQVLKGINSYQESFSDLYADGITEENLFKAIVAYQDYLVSVSRFDRYLHGDENALNQIEKDGYALFLNYGCSSCHQGINLGGNMFQKVGIFKDYFKDRAAANDLAYKEIDYGRELLTGDPSDRHIFRVPSLRNIAMTGPYLHDGSLASLQDAIFVMGRYQLGRDIPDEDVKKIEAFLKTLTGEQLDNSK